MKKLHKHLIENVSNTVVSGKGVSLNRQPLHKFLAQYESLTQASDNDPIGYTTGTGGSVTQGTSKSTTVVLNKLTGQITTHAASLAFATSVSFTLTNSYIGAKDIVLVTIGSGATADSYNVDVSATAAGSCKIQIRNFRGGSLAEAIVLNFAVIKGSIL